MKHLSLKLCMVAQAVLLAAMLQAMVSSCSRKSGEPVMFTGRVLTIADMVGRAGAGTFGKSEYAEVNRDWVLWAYQDFKAEISAGQYGVASWSDRSQCTFFATSFEVYAQKRYFAQAFHSAIPASGVAVGSNWYHPAPGEGHALDIIITQNGTEYFEPQTGRFIILSASQVQSTYFKKFDE